MAGTLERDGMNYLLAGEHPVLSALRQQWAAARVLRRRATGHTYFLSFNVPPGIPRLYRKGPSSIADVRGEVSGMMSPVQLTLQIRDGILDTLMGESTEEDSWSKEPELKRCFYIAPVGNERVGEVPSRDLNWALAEVLERQAAPIQQSFDDILEQLDSQDGPNRADLWSQLVPETAGQAATVQGMLLIATLRLAQELANAGGANWDERHEEYEGYSELVVRCLSDGTFDEQTAQVVRDTMTNLRRWMNSEDVDSQHLITCVYQLGDLAYHWCRRQPALVPWTRDTRFPE